MLAGTFIFTKNRSYLILSFPFDLLWTEKNAYFILFYFIIFSLKIKDWYVDTVKDKSILHFRIQHEILCHCTMKQR